MSSFENDPRRQQELLGRPLADALYKRILGEEIAIVRYDKGDDLILDRKFAIDVTIRLDLPGTAAGMILTGQEKFLSPQYAGFGSLTIEYMQNWRTGERGDWFNLASQFYFCGYLTKDGSGFEPWIMVNWASMVKQTIAGNIEWKRQRNKDGRARADFKWCLMHEIPPDCIIAYSAHMHEDWSI